MSLDNINRVPAGLLQLLELKSQGITPPDLSSVLQGQIDLLPFYVGGNLITDFNFTAAAVAGSTVERIIPAGERWLVVNVTWAILGPTVAGACSGMIEFQPAGQPGVNIIGSGEHVNTIPIQTWGFHGAPGFFPILAGPGDKFKNTLSSLTGGGTCTFELTISAFQLRA